MSGRRLYDLNLRVCFYARVSTDQDNQLNSLNNQLEYYKNYIKSNPNWTYIGGYIDEGLSGVRVDKRESFKKMINDAQSNKFDLIITKEVSRFARDIEDSIHYIRLLKDRNVGVFFENQNLNTFDSNSELVLNIMFNLAQEESKKLSSRIKFGHKQAIKNGHVLGSSNIKGYKKNNCKLIIDEEEAIFIKKMFALYSTGEYGFLKLAKKLGSLGFYNKKGNLYDKESLKRMIQNPKYKGFYRGNTTEIIDYRTKKKIKIKESEQIVFECVDDSVPAIVSPIIWDKANNILKSRTKKYKNHNYFTGGLKYPLSSKIYCSEHNSRFQRANHNKNRPIWACSRYLQYRLDACSSAIIAEIDLYNIIKLIMKKIMPSQNKIVENMLKLYNNSYSKSQYIKELSHVEKEIQIIENKKNIALDFVYNGDISKDELKKQFIYYKNRMNELIKRKSEISKQIKTMEEVKSNTNKIRRTIETEIEGESLEGFIRNFVEKIIVSKINNKRNNIKLDVYLNIDSEKEVSSNKNKTLYLENITFKTLEKRKKNENKYTCNVYLY